MARLYSHFFRTVQDIQGNIVPGVQGTITLADTATLATLYNDPEGTTTLPNPLFNSTQYGSFSVYLDTGHYDMAFLKEGYIFEPLVDIQVNEASGGVTSLVGTPNRVLVSASVGDTVLSTPQDLHPDASLQFAHLGLLTPATAHALTVAGSSDFQALMTTRDVTSSGQVTANIHFTPDHPGDTQIAFYTVLNAAGGTNRWAIHAGGTAPSLLGGTLRVGGPTSLDSTLTVQGVTTCNSTLTVQAGVNAVTLGVTGAVNLYSTLAVASNTTLSGLVGIGGAPDGGYWLRVYGGTLLASLIVSGDTHLQAHSGIGAAPLPGQYHLNAGFTQLQSLRVVGGSSLLGQVDMSAGLNVLGGNGYFAGVVGIGAAPNGVYSLVTGGQAYITSHLTVTGSIWMGDPTTTRVNLGLGSMAVQNANAVAITGGNVNAASLTNNAIIEASQITITPNGKLGLGTGAPVTNFIIAVNWPHSSTYGMTFRPNDGDDTGAGHPVLFFSAGGGVVGSISTSASATGYNTSSDVRLKEAVEPLQGALAVVQALRPVVFRWRADGSVGHGMLAHEVADVVPGAVSGEPDAWDEAGGVLPQGIDYSKLVPWLVGAVQTIAARLEALEGD